MADTSVVDLPGHPRIGARRGTGCLILLSLPFMAVGIGVPWAVRSGAARGEPALLYLFGGLFLLAGLAVAVVGVRSMALQARLNAAASRHPQEPWMRDYLWDRQGGRTHPFRSVLKTFVSMVVFAALLVPFTRWVLADRNPVPTVIVGVIDVALVLSFLVWTLDLARAVKYGAAWIAYDHFPFFLGESLDARLGCGAPLSRFRKVSVTLRFIREHYVKSKYYGTRSPSLVCRQHWGETKELGPQQLQMLSEVPVQFDLPAGDYSTNMGASPACYWEIETRGEAPGVNFASRFLVPVYARGA